MYSEESFCYVYYLFTFIRCKPMNFFVALEPGHLPFGEAPDLGLEFPHDLGARNFFLKKFRKVTVLKAKFVEALP